MDFENDELLAHFQNILKELDFQKYLDNLDLYEINVLLQVITDPETRNNIILYYKKRKEKMIGDNGDNENLKIIEKETRVLEGLKKKNLDLNDFFDVD